MTSKDPSLGGPSLSPNEPSAPLARIQKKDNLTGYSSLPSADALDRYGSVMSINRRPPPSHDIYEGLDRYESIPSTYPPAECCETRYLRAIECNPDLDRYASLPASRTSQTDPTLAGQPYRMFTATPTAEPERDALLCNVLTTAIKDEFGRPWTLISFQPVVPQVAQELGAADERGLPSDHCERNRGSVAADSASAYHSARSCTRTSISGISSVSLDVYSNTEDQSSDSGRKGSPLTITELSSAASDAVPGSESIRSSAGAWSTQGTGRSTAPAFASATSFACRDPNQPSANESLRHDGASSDPTATVLYEAPELSPVSPVQQGSSNTKRNPLPTVNRDGATFGSVDGDINMQCSQVSTTRPLLLHSKSAVRKWDDDFLLVLCASLNVLLFSAFAGVVFSYFLYSGMTPDEQ